MYFELGWVSIVGYFFFREHNSRDLRILLEIKEARIKQKVKNNKKTIKEHQRKMADRLF